MKKIFYLIFFACFFLNSMICPAAEEGLVELDLTEADMPKEITLQDQINTVWEVGSFFEKNYPGDMIFDDLTDDLAKFFPEATTQQLYDRSEWVRDGVRFYRFVREVYDKVKEKMLVPEEPPLIVAEEDYDTGYTGEYIETKPDEVAVIEDFKKVLSYGPDSRDYKAFKEKYIKDAEKEMPADTFENFSRMLKKLEWKKLPFYGLFYEDPFSGRDGMGEWVKQDESWVRLITEDSKIGDKKTVRGAIHFNLIDGYAMLAYQKGTLPAPSFDFSASENLEKASTFRPYPERIIKEGADNDIIAYSGNFAIPVLFEVKDNQADLKLTADVKFSLCRIETGECREVNFKPEMTLRPGMVFRSAVRNFVTQSFNLLPQTGGNLKLKAAVIDDGGDDEGQVLRLVYKRLRETAKVDVFADGEEHWEFQRPRIAINDDEITVRLIPKEKQNNLVGKEFEITVSYNEHDSFREKVVAQEASWFDFMQNQLSLGIILIAILGGFILNFMPCVFPVLSVKLISLTGFGKRKSGNLRREFFLTILGIFLSFWIISAVLCLLKYLGHSIGWGMQFQNPVFLVLMIFVVSLFIAQLCGLIEFRTPEWVNRLSAKTGSKDGIMHFLTGVLVVVMATPCTAPYLGTAVGFALSGSMVDIFVIMTAVALGLSIPYLMLLFVSDISIYLPKPGAWMNKLSRFMILMLLLTLVWLMSVLYAQTDVKAIIHLSLYLLAFVIFIALRSSIVKKMELLSEDGEIKRLAYHMVNAVIILLCLIFVFFSVLDVNRHFDRHRKINLENKLQFINYQEIADYVKDDNIVIVAVGADWCLTCMYNDVAVFSNFQVRRLLNEEKFVLIEVDWTNYNEEVLDFMEKFGRKGLPFYVLFSKMIPDGMVLPEVLTERSFMKIIEDIKGR